MSEDISQVDYNRWFVDQLKMKRKSFIDFVETATHEDVEYIRIEIPPPSGEKEAIVISTYGPELTMFYHTLHVHFDMFADDDEQEEFDRLLQYIDFFMNEELVSVSEFDGDRWCSSYSADANELIEAKEGRTVIVKSWKGTYSRTIE